MQPLNDAFRDKFRRNNPRPSPQPQPGPSRAAQLGDFVSGLWDKGMDLRTGRSGTMATPEQNQPPSWSDLTVAAAFPEKDVPLETFNFTPLVGDVLGPIQDAPVVADAIGTAWDDPTLANIEEAALATLLGGLGALPFIPSMAGVILSPKSPLANKELFDKAKKMFEDGADLSSIYRETGFDQDVLGNWAWNLPDYNSIIRTSSDEVFAAAEQRSQELSNLAAHSRQLSEDPNLPLGDREAYRAQAETLEAEMADIQATMTAGGMTGVWPVEYAWDHADLWKAAPELKDLKVAYGKNYPPRVAGGFDPYKNTMSFSKHIDPAELRATLFHETNHAYARHYPEFPQGGNDSVLAGFAGLAPGTGDIRAVKKVIDRVYGLPDVQTGALDFDEVDNLLARELAAAGYPNDPTTKQLVDVAMATDNKQLAWIDDVFKYTQDPEQAYRLLPGEANARLSEVLGELSPEELAARDRLFEYDVRTELLAPVHSGEPPGYFPSYLQGLQLSKKPAPDATAEFLGPLPSTEKPLATTFADVPQVPIPRYDPPRGVSPRLSAILQDDNVHRGVEQAIERGVDMGMDKWYHNGNLLDAWVAELGPQEGPYWFDKFMQYQAATSPRSPVPQNIRTGSYYYSLDRQGLPMPEVGAQNPHPYGSMAQRNHQMLARDVFNGGMDPIKNPKPPSYGANLGGNHTPVAGDTHAFRLPAILSGDPRFLETSVKNDKTKEVLRPQRLYQSGQLSIEDAKNRPALWASAPNANEYKALEQFYTDKADKFGLKPAEAQSAAWSGGGHITGLESPANLTYEQMFFDRVMLTARARGENPETTLRRAIRGEAPLLGMAAVPVAGATFGTYGQEEQQPPIQ